MKEEELIEKLISQYNIPKTEYWSPLRLFRSTPRGRELLNLWKSHYERLGVRTKLETHLQSDLVTERFELLIHVLDDFRAYPRNIPAEWEKFYDEYGPPEK